MKPAIAIDRDKIVAFWRQHHVKKLALFGSVLRDDFSPDSDVDVLVEFEPGRVPGFIKLYGIEQQFSELLDGREVDLVTEKSLNPRIRESALANMEVLYAEG